MTNLRALSALALAGAVLWAGSSPAFAYDTATFGNKTIAWQTRSGRLVDNMGSSPASTRATIRKLILTTRPHLDWLEASRPNACQVSHGDRAYYLAVLRYHNKMVSAYNAARTWRPRALRLVKEAIAYYYRADRIAARIIRECW